MGTPFVLESTLQLPGAPGLELDSIAARLEASYDSKAEFEFKFPSSAGSQSVNFGTLPAGGAKAVFVHYELATAAPVVLVTVGGSTVELSSGGFLALGSPSPSAGITTMSIAYTGAGRVRVWLLG